MATRDEILGTYDIRNMAIIGAILEFGASMLDEYAIAKAANKAVGTLQQSDRTLQEIYHTIERQEWPDAKYDRSVYILVVGRAFHRAFARIADYDTAESVRSSLERFEDDLGGTADRYRLDEHASVKLVDAVGAPSKPQSAVRRKKVTQQRVVDP